MPDRHNGLTDRQHQIVDLISHGHNRESVAHQLGISTLTVRQHLHDIYLKLGVNSQLEMVLKLYDLKEKA